MEIESIRHKALRRFVYEGNSRGLDGNLIFRIRAMLTFIEMAPDFEILKLPPNYGLHPLTGDRSGSWSMTVTRNWRMTFVKVDEVRIAELDLEDYH